MPYITKERQAELATSTEFDAGDANFLITTEYIIPAWKQNRRYSTIARLEEVLHGQTSLDWALEEIKTRLLRGGLTPSAVASACRLAFLEFYRRIGCAYEDVKIESNGDVYDAEAEVVTQW